MNEQTSKLTDRDIIALVFAHAGLVSDSYQADSFYQHIQNSFNMADIFLEIKQQSNNNE